MSSRDAGLQGYAYVIGKKKHDWSKEERATVELFLAASGRNDLGDLALASQVPSFVLSKGRYVKTSPNRPLLNTWR